MRLVRVPYFYLPDAHVKALYVSAYRLIRIIGDIHHEEPNKDWRHPQVKHYMYHPSFVRWVLAKAGTQMAARGFSHNVELGDKLLRLRSRPLTEFVPPTDAEIAEDVVWLLEKWQWRLKPGGKKLPYSYVELAQQYYGYSPHKAAVERVDQVSGRHRDADRDWYQPQGEEASQIGGHTVGESLRRRRDV